MALPPKTRIVSIRAKVPQNTSLNAPLSIKTQIQNPIIESVGFWASGAALEETGFRILINGTQAFPAIESVATPDMVGAENFIPLPDTPQEIETGLQVSGAPYNVELQFYNIDAAAPFYAAVYLHTLPKIELTPLPIQDDKTSTKPEYDS